MKKFVLLLLTVALLFSGTMLLKKRKQSIKDRPPPAPPIHQVEVISATMGKLEQTRSFLARLASLDTAEISSKLSGRIMDLLVKENQSVKKGDLLLQIDDLEIVSNIESLRVNLKAQEKDVHYVSSLHERNKALFKVGGLSREKFEASEVTYVTKKAGLDATLLKIAGLESQLSYLNITSPFDGTVGTIFSRKGDLASPGKPLLSINSPQQKLIFNYVPVDFGVEPGQKVFFKEREIGKISTLYNDAQNGLFVAEVAVDSPLKLPNNSYLTIDLLTFTGSGCTVPLATLLRTKEKTQVMVHENQAFKPLLVKIIAENREQALIEPCPTSPIAVAAAAKLSQLPGYGDVVINRGGGHE